MAVFGQFKVVVIIFPFGRLFPEFYFFAGQQPVAENRHVNKPKKKYQTDFPQFEKVKTIRFRFPASGRAPPGSTKCRSGCTCPQNGCIGKRNQKLFIGEFHGISAQRMRMGEKLTTMGRLFRKAEKNATGIITRGT
jgi:hypothetical protein